MTHPDAGSAARKRELLARRLRERAAKPAAYPLSFGQQRLWFLEKFSPGGAVYNIPLGLRLRGPLDRAALKHALDAVVARHAALRTTFPDSGGEPVQLVTPTGAVALEEFALPDGDRDAAARGFADERGAVGFDLQRGPLFAASLGRFADDDHVLVLNLHHITSDAWSLSVLLRELGAGYAAALDGRAAELPELRLQYPDFAVWQRDRMAGEVAAAHLDYWARHLDGAPELLTLPTDRPRPAVSTYRGALRYGHVPAGTVQALEALARKHGVTLFMVLLAAFAARLGRLAGQDDVVVGTPVAGRSHPDLENLIGFFVNTLALRTSVAGDPTFAELLERTKQSTVDGLAHAELPFERLVEHLRPQRSLGHAPLFQAQLILQNTPPLAIDLRGLAVESITPDPGVSKFDMTVAAEHRGDTLALGVEYSTDLFDEDTIADFTDRLIALLVAAAEHPERRISELDALTGVRRWEVLEGFNATELPLPRATTALDLIDGEPDAPAVGPLGYRELGERSDHIAALLQRHGVGRGSLVALHLPRTSDLVAAVLGVWKAGAAYLPLDPGWPPNRLALMLADSGAEVVLTDPALDPLAFDGMFLTPADATPATPAPTPVHPDDLAYVIYTSGSTGTPKGVEVPHRAVVNLLVSFQQVFGLTAEDRLAAVTTLSFDISVLELLLPLTTGASVVVVPPEVAGDGAALREVLADATVLQATPATWRLLVEAGGVPDGVTTRICGGEALPRDLADDLLTGESLLWNVYGPTETTVWSAAGLVDPSPAPVVIGPPIGNTRLYVLDAGLEPVPPGVVGELHIGGLGVARGYRGRPELTASRFVPDPFATTPGARLYATGDLVRHRADGTLEFLGRADHQVKVRGFRIELGEIETALVDTGEVRQAVVVPQDARLVAYLVADHPLDWARLRSALAGRLPDYMLPATAVVLDAFPLTPNGKIDRAALPEPDWAAGGERVAPRNAVEEVLAGIWREVLAVPEVGVHDDFFALGGHSLLAAKALARVHGAFAVSVPIGRLFAAPTVAGLAGTLLALDEPDRITAVAELRVQLAGLSDDEVAAMLGEGS
ncbi:amino acid adenylation domain-containing protein [Actinosynnema sp. CA-248983]